MLTSFNPQQLSFLIILIGAFLLLLTEKLRNDLVAILIILALYLTRVLSPTEALAGFSSEPAIVIAAIFVLSSALHQTGVSETFGVWIGRLAGHSYSRMIAVIMPAVAVLSAFTHHVTTTAIMLPVTLELSRERNIPSSKLLMPLSFAASLGTTITIIGAPAFLVADGILRQSGRPGLSIFSIAPIGLVLSLAGTLFILLVGRFLLPSRQGSENAVDRFRLDDYFTEFTILPDSPFLGKTVDEVESDDRYQLKVIGWLRNGYRLRRPYGDQQLEAGDVLLIRTRPEDLVAIRQEPGVELHPIVKHGAETPVPTGDQEELTDLLVQAVVAPGSEQVGRTIGEIDFRQRYGVVVLSLWRKQGWFDQELAKTRLRPGDVLVLQGDEEALARVEQDRAFLMLMPFQGELRLRRKARLAGFIMLATILVSAFNWMALEMAVLAGAAAIVLTGCLTMRQAYRAIDTRIFVFIAGALPLGVAMQKTGTSTLIANWLSHGLRGWHQIVILLALFAVVAALTQLMSDAATTALMAPVAVALAQTLGYPPEAFVITVAMAAVASFLTPIGHHGNLLIYGPGGYQFRDFIIVGTPLTILIALIVTIMAPVVFR
ncbi:MAG: anion permease [Acidobacteria bacterium]|nr:anion permease [Acidobacteriota bacterium]